MNYLNDVWNPWTEVSNKVNFKSSLKAIGNGEKKLGAEFNKNPLGQNFAFDLEINGEKWEVKTLDNDNSFRLGVEVSTHYSTIIGAVIRILENVISIHGQLLDSEFGQLIRTTIYKIESVSGRGTTGLLEGLRKNEVSKSNLDKANKVIEELKWIIMTDGKITLYSSVDGKKREYEILEAFKKIILEKLSIEETIKIIGDRDIYNRLLLTNCISDDIIIFENNSLRERLNKIIRDVFLNVKLVLVHETKGYKPITKLDTIYCNRITSGKPRCKIIE